MSGNRDQLNGVPPGGAPASDVPVSAQGCAVATETPPDSAALKRNRNGTADDPLVSILHSVQRFPEQLKEIASAQLELIKLRAMSLAIFLVLGTVVGVLVVVGSVIAVSHVIGGLSGGLTSLTQGPAWLGDLLAGGLVLALFSVGSMLLIRRAYRRHFAAVRSKFEGGEFEGSEFEESYDPDESA